jgi:hypothetical protein
MTKKISYSVRDFAGLREELVNMTKQYYPDLISNFNDASIYSVLLDLNAAVTDNLHFHIDRVWQETMLDFAQQKQSLFHIAKTYGLKIPGLKPSVALCDFSINVGVSRIYGDKDDERYEGVLKAGAQVSGGGQVFETIDDIDFSSPFNSKGEPNRLKIPNRNNNGEIISYTITKREVVVNGITKIYRRVINDLDQKPFLKLYLPEKNVLGVTSIIHKDGTTYGANPSYSEFTVSNNKWYEVNSLIENKVFIDDPTSISDANNFKAGTYISVNNKFITEYTPEGYFSITFGSGNVNPMDNLDNYMSGTMKVNLASFLNNDSLGNVPKPNTTLFVKYRVGGGKDTNLGVNVISSIDTVDFVVNGPNKAINSQVQNSLRVTNITPAIGGSDYPSIEEIRNMIAYNFSAQNRAVTLNDYRSLIQTMPSIYGAPAQVNVMEEDNKVRIKMLSYDDEGNLTDNVSTTLKDNVLNYLSKYRMLNDYLDVVSGEVIDLGLEIDIVVDKNENQTDIVKQVVSGTTEFFNVMKRKMGDPLFIGDLKRMIGNVVGVVNVIDVRVFNLIGGKYSSAEVSQSYKNPVTKEILQNEMMIYMKSNQIYQIRYPSSDIKIRIKTLSCLNY